VAPRDGYKNKLQTFSGGNQQKVLLGKWLRLHPKVLLLDEPTQGVDIGARALIHSELIAAAASGMAIICSSTDFDELSAICQRIIIFHDGRISATLEGDEITVQNISQACLAGDTTDTTR
jgi:ribose transport system ATP-binding protein